MITSKGCISHFNICEKLVKRASIPFLPVSSPKTAKTITNSMIKTKVTTHSSMHNRHTISSVFITKFCNRSKIMFFSSIHSIIRRVKTYLPLLLCAATWTILLTLTVAIASFAPEVAFVSAISPSSSFSKSCHADGFVRIPLDFPKESVCFPSHVVKRSKLDFFVPTVFAALAVAGSAFVVRSLGLWDGARG